jgi:hypothetical protein
MLDWVPFRVWVLIAIAVVAWPVALYVYRYLGKSAEPSDIAEPSMDSGARSPERLALHLVALAALVVLAFYVFTPAAEEFVRSPRFSSLLMIGFGGFVFYTVVAGLIKGEMEPFLKARFGPYSRDGHPVRYWLSAAGNSALGALMVWIALTQQF